MSLHWGNIAGSHMCSTDIAFIGISLAMPKLMQSSVYPIILNDSTKCIFLIVFFISIKFIFHKILFFFKMVTQMFMFLVLCRIIEQAFSITVTEQ